jgi:hypothetical protein
MSDHKIDPNVMVTPVCFKMIDEIYSAYEEYFSDQLSVLRIGVAVALAQGLEVDRNIKPTEAKGQSNSFLLNGKVESLLRLFGNNGNPLIEGQYLGEAGVKFLHEKHTQNVEIRNYLVS